MCYVRVVGNMRSFNEKRSLIAFKVRAIDDMNEVFSLLSLSLLGSLSQQNQLTFHLINIIRVHLYHTRGAVSYAVQQHGLVEPKSEYGNYSSSSSHQPQQSGNNYLADLVCYILGIILKEIATNDTNSFPL